MNMDEAINECEILLKQIKQYEPDPFYVNYFFDQFIDKTDYIISGIFEEANNDFGLFLTEQFSEKSFYEKAKVKNDKNAIKFSEWFAMKYSEEHENLYPNFISKIFDFKKKFGKLPQIKIMIRAKDRYKDDVNQQIKINLSNEKLRSKKELQIEIKRQMPIFLEIINSKRQIKNEPKVKENQIVASTFLGIENQGEIEIVYATQIYIPVLRRLVGESRKKIRELTSKTC